MVRPTQHHRRSSSSVPATRGSSRCCCRRTVPVAWAGFVDGDDYVEPTMFERLVDAAAGCDADLAMCQYQEVIDGSGERRDPADAHRWAELTAPCCELKVQTRRQFL